jgi:hypothetical protein
MQLKVYFENIVSFQVCPVCAALPRGDPNHVTDDFIAHLTMEHKSQSIRDFISFLHVTAFQILPGLCV